MDDQILFTKIDLVEPAAGPIAVRGRNPLSCRVLLDLCRAALFARNQSVLQQTLDELDELTVEHFLCYCPHSYLIYAECLIACGDGDNGELVSDLIRRARSVGVDSQNPWVKQEADRLGKQHFQHDR